MNKKLFTLILGLLSLHEFTQSRGGGGHGGGGHGGGHGEFHGRGHNGGHGGNRSYHSGHVYHGGWGAWGGWGWGLGLGLGVGLASNRWYTAPGYYGGTYIDNDTYNNYFYDQEALFDKSTDEKVADYSEKDRQSGLKKHIAKLKFERKKTNNQEKIDAIDKRIKQLEKNLKGDN